MKWIVMGLITAAVVVAAVVLSLAATLEGDGWDDDEGKGA